VRPSISECVGITMAAFGMVIEIEDAAPAGRRVPVCRSFSESAGTAITIHGIERRIEYLTQGRRK